MRNKSILLVAMPNSVHTARWVNQIIGKGWKIYIYPSLYTEQTHPDINEKMLIRSPLERSRAFFNKNGLQFAARLNGLFLRYFEKRSKRTRAVGLRNAIRKLHPDLIHSLEMQNAGYLTLEAKMLTSERFPQWILTIWGSDIFLFGRLQQHKEHIREVLANCDYYSCECDRDLKLANVLGFNGSVFPAFPITGGFDLEQVESDRNITPASSRKIIMLKGYQGWAGRALCGLRALERCAELLDDYTIVIYSASADVVMAAELFSEKTGVSTKILPHGTPHEDMLAMHGQARISIGLGISDGISVSMQEAIVMGSFPIQSCTACADEWIEHGVSGMIVPPEDPNVIEIAIRIALNDDRLVDNAANLNWQIALNRLDGAILQKKSIDMYKHIFNQPK